MALMASRRGFGLDVDIYSRVVVDDDARGVCRGRENLGHSGVSCRAETIGEWGHLIPPGRGG